ncbi:hypothetical protein [Halomonas sp. H5]|uniref:hypothetical protein n=1 Tax=Halomonas sp. H5 TaxID=3423910 RepID=UPI003D36A8E5
MMNVAELTGSKKVVARRFEDAEEFYRLFSLGASIQPATFETLMAAQRIKEGWPPVSRMMDALGAVRNASKAESAEALGVVIRVLGAAGVIRQALDAGARIGEPETKTPGSTPKG